MTNHILAKFCSAVVRKATFVLCLAACTLGLSIFGSAQKYRIISFDAPGAGTRAGQGTLGIGINRRGEINGFYIDANFVYHGFLRSPKGTFTTFDAPDAGGFGTFPYGLNQQGVTVGYYNTPDFVYHGFLRSQDGPFTTFTTFTDPDACTTSILVGCEGTGFHNINLFGVIAGGYSDAKFVIHGLVINPDGKFTHFDAPGAGDVPGSYQGTYDASFSGLNDFGAITGTDYDRSNVGHGFLRYPNGRIIKFDAPGAGTMACPSVFDACQGTYPASLNDFGVITGDYLDANGVYHGFIRGSNGTFAAFQAPGADMTEGSFNGTFPANINLYGAITGSYVDTSNVSHGFVRAINGSFITFEAADAGTGSGQGTFPFSNNDYGAITGNFVDEKNVNHGFVAIPCGRSCMDNDQDTTSATRESPPPMNPTTETPVDAPFPGMLDLKLRRLPMYRNVGTQPSR
jgi:hypothetical protein